MGVQLCYPLFSAELESAKALASSQQKFQTLNFVDESYEAINANDSYLPTHVPGEYGFKSRPDV